MIGRAEGGEAGGDSETLEERDRERSMRVGDGVEILSARKADGTAVGNEGEKILVGRLLGGGSSPSDVALMAVARSSRT